jgi:hypothetical protein
MSDDSIVKTLVLKAQCFGTDASLYGKMIENNQLYYNPNDTYMKNLVSQRDGFVNQQSHANFKQTSQNCLNCSKVLTCSNKCDKL